MSGVAVKSTYMARPKFWRFEVPRASLAPRTAALTVSAWPQWDGLLSQ